MAGEGAEKRKAEDGDAQEATKRPRVEGSNGGAPAAAAPAKKLGIDLEKLQKAKAALQKQKELAERLKKAGITVRGAAPAGPRAAAVAAGERRQLRVLVCIPEALHPTVLHYSHHVHPAAARCQARTSSGSTPATSGGARRGGGGGGGSSGGAGCSSWCGRWAAQCAQAGHQAAAAAHSRRAGARSGCHWQAH